MADATDPPAGKRRSRLRWWHAPVVLVLVFLLLALAFVARIHFEWDLIGFRQRAADQGIELDPETFLPAVDERALALLNEWRKLFDSGAGSYRKQRAHDDPEIRPALSLPVEAVEHYTNLPRQQWQTFDRLLIASVALPEFRVLHPIHLNDYNHDSSDIYQIAQQIVDIGCDRIRLCPDAEAAPQAQLLARWIDSQPVISGLDIYIRAFHARRLRESLTSRLSACREQPDASAALAKLLRRQAVEIRDHFTTVIECDLVLIHALLIDKDALREYSQKYKWRYWMPWCARATRKDFLDQELDLLLDLRRIDAWPEFYTLLRQKPQREYGYGWKHLPGNAMHFAELAFSTDLKLSLKHMTRLRLGNQLLAAELLDEPWPVDCCDPAGQALRPLHIDGGLIAAYSVGLDGVDDGGDEQKDLIFWLHGHRDKDGRVNWADEDPALIYATQPTP